MLALVIASCLTAIANDRDDADFFESRVRPVIVERCVKCHGPKKQEMGLRLDSRAALMRGSEAGPVVVAGDPQSSSLIEAIHYDGPTKMPPDKRLSDQAIADLEAWVKRGTPWPESASTAAAGAPSPSTHWAFRPVTKPGLPAVDAANAKSSIDVFISARLTASSLTFSPAADRRTLLRRVTIDLIGLPPSPDDIDAFVNDTRPDDVAYASVVDRLLASPRYGERWGRHWLDVARYADTKGYVFLEEPNYPWAYAYRDYVIRSLNDDAPYDQFVTEQIAADRLGPDHDRRALAALGFLTVGGRFMNNEHDILDDRIDVVTRGLMGLTVTCARCHDHKFDPVSQKDYYALYGVFASSVEPTVPPLFEPPPDTDDYRSFAKELSAREAKLADFVSMKHSELVISAKKRVDEYLMFVHDHRDQPPTEDFMQIADAADLNPVIVGRWRAFFDRARRTHHPVFAPWFAIEELKDASGDAIQQLVGRLAVDAQKPLNPIVVQAFKERRPATLAEAAKVYRDVLWNNEWIVQDHERRAALEGGGGQAHPNPAREQLRIVFHGIDAPPDVPLKPEGDLALLPDRPSQETLKQLLGAIEQWRATGPGAPPRAMALVDSEKPHDTPIFLRGNPNRPGPAALRGFPAFLADPTSAQFHDGSGRLELAHAIVSTQNPLTVRVLVNRLWMHHFGTPLVATPGDFGLRSESPSHPELLDWLAATFMEDGWSLKALHRRIVTSHAYRQSSLDRPEAATIDPENRLYWRANRRRLDFESTRDALLCVSESLDGKIGGPSMPNLSDAATPRRTLYGHIDRLNLPGLYRTFDFPDPNVTSPKRDQTTVPPQALFLLNHPMVDSLMDRLVHRSEVAKADNDETRVDALYRLIIGRLPSADERTLAVDYLRSQANNPQAAKRLAHALVLSNEFVFVD